MLRNNLIKILNTFSRKEMTRFVEFSRSPYFNKHEEVGMLIDYLNKTYPNFNAQNCQREVIFKITFSTAKTQPKPFGAFIHLFYQVVG